MEQRAEHSVPPQFIGGRWRAGSDGAAGRVTKPAAGDVLAQVPRASWPDRDAALDASQRAFGLWRATSAHERGAVLRRAAQLLRERAPAVAWRMTPEQGPRIFMPYMGGVGVFRAHCDEVARQGYPGFLLGPQGAAGPARA